MLKNCLNLISEDDFIILKNSKNKSFYNCNVEYKKHLDSLNDRELENEWSQNLDILDSLKYTYNFVKSYYYINIINVAKHIINDELYINIDNINIENNSKNNLIRLTNNIKVLFDYIDNYSEKISSFTADYPSHAYSGEMTFDEKGNYHEDNSRTSLIKNTFDLAYKCASIFTSLNDIYRSFTCNYNIDMLMINPKNVSEETKKQLLSFPNFVLGKEPNDRIQYYSNTQLIFEIFGCNNI